MINLKLFSERLLSQIILALSNPNPEVEPDDAKAAGAAFAADGKSVNNILGFDNIFGYRFNNQADQDGVYISMPIKSPQKRFVVVGVVVLLDDPM